MKKLKLYPGDKKLNRVFKIKNFKIFKDETTFELSSLNLLVGKNSAGKSSFMKFLKLISSNFSKEEKDFQQFEYLDLTNQDIDLGITDRIRNFNSKDENLFFETNFFSAIWGEVFLKFTYEPFKGHKRYRLKQLIFLKKDGKTTKEIVQLNRILIDCPSSPDEKCVFWNLYFDPSIWVAQFDALVKYGKFQEDVQNLYVKIYDLYQIHKENYDKKLALKEKKLFEKLKKNGLSPIHEELNSREANPFTYGGYFQTFRLNQINTKEKISYNEIANKLYKIAKENPYFIDYPIIHSDEWKLLFDNTGNLKEKDAAKKDINLINPAYNKIDELYNFFEKYEVNHKKHTKKVLKNLFSRDIQITILDHLLPFRYGEQYVDFDSEGNWGINYVKGYLPNKFSDFYKRFTQTEPRKGLNLGSVYDDELKDFNLIKEGFKQKNNTTIYLQYHYKNESHNSSFGENHEYWGKYFKSTQNIMNLITNFFKQGLESFKDINEMKFIDSNINISNRIFSYQNQNSLTNLLNEFESLNSFSEEYIRNESSFGYKEKTVNEFIKIWVNEFKIADDFEIKDEKEGVGKRIYLKKGKQNILISDNGLGSSKLFFLIFNTALRAKPNSILYVEEPEANLHPALQSKLANFFYDAINTLNIKLIIETHSEYFVRKLQLLTGIEYSSNNKQTQKPENDPSVYILGEKSKFDLKDTNIFFFNHPKTLKKNEKQVIKIKFNNDGSLTDSFKSGFTDEADNIKLKLIKQKMKSSAL